MLSERQLRIINKIIAAPEPVKIQDLVSVEGVSLQTIYSDLRSIERIGISVNRGRVGVVFAEDGNSTVGQKVDTDRAIRQKACEYVIDSILEGKPKGVIFIDGGSTGYIFFEELRKKGMRDLVIITNNPLVIGSLSEDEDFFYHNSIFATGGKVDPMRISLYSIGRRADFIPIKEDGNILDVCILGVRAISDKGDLYIENEEEVSQKKYLILKSRQLIVIVTPGKIGTTGLFKIASLSKEIKKKGVDIVVASDGALGRAASDTIKGLTRLLGESSIRLLNEY